MMTVREQRKQALIADFIRFLDNQEKQENPENREERALPDFEKNPASVDLFSLFLELTALKTEVKQESRLFKTTVTQIQSLLSQADSHHERLYQAFAQCRQEQRLLEQHQRHAVQKPLLLAMVEWRDRLARSMSEVKAALELEQSPPSRLRRWWRRHKPKPPGWLEGQHILRRHVDQVLETHDVSVLSVLQHPYDPQTMRAVGFESHPDVPEAWVMKEWRSGFLWQGTVLRPAEVIVNRYRGEERHA